MYHFIANPTSQAGKGAAILARIEEKMKEQGVPYELHCTEYDGHATKIARELTSGSDEVTIIVIGGDGSVNEVVNGLARFEGVTLGLIPSGSGNDLAKSLKLPKDPLECLSLILSGDHVQEINVGVMETASIRRRFLSGAGIGFDAAVCDGILRSKIKDTLNKIGLGKLAYLGVALTQLAHLNACTHTIRVDGGKAMVFPHTLFTVSMNHPYEGGGFKFCPDAKNGDDRLDVCLVNGISPVRFLLMFPFATFGAHVRFRRYVHIFRGKKIEVRTERLHHIHTDGEPIAVKRGLTAYLEDEKLRTIAP